MPPPLFSSSGAASSRAPVAPRLGIFLIAVVLALAGAAVAEDVTDDAAPSIRLTDVSARAGVGDARGDRFSFGDYDGDGDPDLLVAGRTLFENRTKGFGTDETAIEFVDVTEASGIGDGPGGGACWVDLDRDGDLDVVTTGGAIKVQVSPGRFRDEAAAWGLRLQRAMASVAVADVDGDGYHDVLYGGGEDWNDGDPVYFPRIFLRNVSGKRFEEATEDHDLGGGRYGRSVTFADHDGDGDLDAYVGNYRLQANELLVNENGRLVNRGQAAGVEGRFSTDRVTLPDGQTLGYRYGHTIAAAWSDLDADGDLDLWVSNLVHKFAGSYEGQLDVRGWICDDSAIYRNDGPPAFRFTDVREASGIPVKPTGDRGVFRGDELWSHALCGDLDGDLLPEVFVTQVYTLPYSHSLLFRNGGGLRFEEVSEAAGVRRFDSYGGAFADLDGDGDLDLVTNGRAAPDGPRAVKVYRNDTAPGPWVAFRVFGAGGDPLPIGAQVELVTEGGRAVRAIDGAMGSHAQQNEGVLRFGLRRAGAVREARVRWPGGVTRTLEAPATGRVHPVAYPEASREGD